jgi:isoleucyl-tRNA synthetase
MRISKEILKQLSQAYLKIRNTARYMLGNLNGFDPDRDLVAYDQLPELDQYALHCYNELVKAVRESYDRYEFHGVYRAIYNFCVVDMSNLYLDIIKDRLYCEGTASVERRSAQTVLYTILDGMTRMLGPVLAFTSDEIWAAMPHTAAENSVSVVLNDMPDPDQALELSDEAKARWEKLIYVRDAVNKALEVARGEGVFKKAQDTEVNIAVRAEDKALLDSVDLAALCIVSKVTVTEGVPGESGEDCLVPCAVAVKLSEAPKCVRCWNHNDQVGADSEHPELCPRCAKVVRGMDLSQLV